MDCLLRALGLLSVRFLMTTGLVSLFERFSDDDDAIADDTTASQTQ